MAGTPPIITLSGNIPETTAPAATMQLSPITVPSSIVAFAPIQQFRPILTPPFEFTPCSRIGVFFVSVVVVFGVYAYVIAKNGVITYFHETGSAAIMPMTAKTDIIPNLHTLSE